MKQATESSKLSIKPQVQLEAKTSTVIAQALKDAGVDLVTHVPGHAANRIFDAYCQIDSQQNPISFNEEVAFTIAHGASMVGSRAATIIKSHGFAKAGNSVIDSLFTGTTAGFVNIVIDDRQGTHSDSVFDVRSYLEGVKIPFILSNPPDVYDGLHGAIKQSEYLALPVVFLIEAESVELNSTFYRKPLDYSPPAFEPDITRYFLQPVFCDYQKRILEAKLKHSDWKLIPKPKIPKIPDGLPERWLRHMEPYFALFDIFKTLDVDIVTGDTGISHLFAFPPYNCCDISTYMGGSIPLAIGAYLGIRRKIWALIGDFSFVAAGHMGVLEAIQRGTPIKILIFLNGKAAATGGQPIPDEVWNPIFEGYSKFTKFINNPFDQEEIRRVLNEANDSKDLRVVIADYRERF